MSDQSAVKLALKAKEIRAQAGSVIASDPIAIIGMAARVPGADGVDAFWELLSQGKDAIRPIPAHRLDIDALYDPDLAAPGKSHVREAALLDAIDGFDAGYFDILSREAEQMDPQARLFLEVAIEALDDAGLLQSQLAGSRTGAFVASIHNDYASMVYADRDAIDLRTLTGTLHSVLVNRLSYLLDLRGPSVSVDTACSASLVAVHLACQSLRMGESDTALAGGVSLVVAPEMMIALSKVGFMAPDGRSKTFDASADGFGRGEGCGVVVLKRLSDALADGDRLLAVIRGSAVNQDGRSTILTAPNGLAQQALIREALAAAQVGAARIGYVETHGTGTALGDPIEVEALAATIGREGTSPCRLGAAKANIGHLEAAAGVVGLIKSVLALKHGAIPPQPHFKTLSPHFELAGTRFEVPRTLIPWPAGEVARAAAVSSFGVGGTNAHVILEEPPRLPSAPAADETRWRLLPLSAKSTEALSALEISWRQFAMSSEAGIADLCTTAALRRTHFSRRRTLTVRSKADIVAALDAGGEAPAAGHEGAPRVGFVFSGQGPQWHAMGRQLLADEPVFRAVIEACDRELLPLSGWSLIEELGTDEARSRVAETEVAQPALFSIQVALAALLEEWGIRADAVTGHSIGELAALHVAGVLELGEAMRIVYHRARLMQRATGLGAMASVSLEAEDLETLLREHPEIDVAAFNAPKSMVLSGASDPLGRALADLQARGIAHRELPVRHAFHSAQMEPLAAELVDCLGRIRTAPASAALYSTVSGGHARTTVDARYFGRNVREPVRFNQAIAAMARDGCDVFLEIGPHPVLGAAIEDTLAAAGQAARIGGTLRRGRDEREMLLRAAGMLYEAGVDLDWDAIDGGDGRPVALPAYPWQRRRHWIRQRPTSTVGAGPLVHPVLGRRVPTALAGVQIYEGRGGDVADWCPDHRIFGEVLMPGAGMLCAFAVAAGRALGDGAVVSDVVFTRPLVVNASSHWQTLVRHEGARASIELFAAGDSDDEWLTIASATADTDADRGEWQVPALPAEAEQLDARTVYAAFASLEVDFGPAFRLLDRMRIAQGSAGASIPAVECADDALHPACIDAAFQLCALTVGDGAAPSEAMLPIGVDRCELRPVSLDGPLEVTVATVRSGRTLKADARIANRHGEDVVRITGAQFAQVDRTSRSDRDDDIYTIEWQPAGDKAQAAVGDVWLLFEDAAGFARAVADQLAHDNLACNFVRPGAGFEKLDERTWSIDPAAPDQFARLLAALPDRPLRIAHFWALVAGDTLDATDLLASGSAMHLVQAAAKRGNSRIMLVTRGGQAVSGQESPAVLNPTMSGLWGLASAITAEHPDLSCRLIDADPYAGSIDGLVAELRRDDGARIALRDGTRLAPRWRRYHAPASTTQSAPVRVSLTQAGSFDGLAIEPLTVQPPGAGEVRLRIISAGLNFRDVLATLDMVPGERPCLGVESVGVVIECGAGAQRFAIGTRVFGYAPGSFASEAVVPERFLAAVPARLSSTLAAAIPVAYLTAYHGLHTLAGLSAGERVLVHAGAGGVGLAAVHLAVRAGAHVFATAGSDEKRALLRELGVAQVFDSRSIDFADEVLAATAGDGVDVILNSLAGPFVDASFRALAEGGRFLEIGKRDVWSTERSRRDRPDAAYHLYDLGSQAEAGNVALAPALDAIVAGLEDGSLPPLPVASFSLDRIGEGMRLMAQARHVGKIVLTIGEDAVRVEPLVTVGTVLVTGGLGGVGLETVRWLAAKGVKSIALLGRSAPSAGAQALIDELATSDVSIRVVPGDVGDESSLSAALGLIAREMPRLSGVIHAAGSVSDGVLLEQHWDVARQALVGKAHGAHLLDRMTRHLPLDFFIVYSAASVWLGAPGMGLYPAANAELDLLAERRRRLGLPGLSVGWGLWQGLGMSTGSSGRKWEQRGLRPVDPAKGFAAIERLLDRPIGHAMIAPIDWKAFLRDPPQGHDQGFFADVAGTRAAASNTRAAPGSAPSPLIPLRAAPAAQRADRLRDYLRAQALAVIGLDAGTRIDPTRPLKELGVDSLMAVELRNLLVRAAGVALPATVLFDHPTLDALVLHLMGAWDLEQVDAVAVRAAPPKIDDFAELDDEEAEALLLAELAQLREAGE